MSLPKGHGFGLAFVFAIFTLAGTMSHARAEAVADAMRSDNPSAAVELATKSLASERLAPMERANLLMNRGLAYERLGRHDDALVDFTEAINSRALAAPDQAKALFDRGVTLEELGSSDDAIGDYSAALRLSPKFPVALNNRANLYRKLGRLAEAKRDYEASIEAGNGAVEYPRYGLGQIAETQGDLPAAKGEYRQALAANPGFALAAQRLTALGDDAEPAIVLRPPGGIVLHMPAKKQHSKAVTAAHAKASGAPGLRPAIADSMSAASGPQIQLGAWRDQAAAADAWNKIDKRAGDVLSGLKPQIVSVDLPGKGRYYRLRVGPVNRERANTTCEKLQERGFACMFVR
jgi:tetratricopeptide (TPR) repeat protein